MIYFSPFLVLYTLFFVKFTGIHGIVNSLDCSGVNNIYSDIGTKVTLTCNVQTASIVWTIQPGDTTISFNSFTDDTGDSKIVNDIYNATYVNETAPVTSTLAFILNGSLNGTSITCGDGGLPGNEMTCFILVIAPPILSSESITIPSSTYESVLLQWSPSFNGGSNITRYYITVVPLPSNSITTCPEGQCNITDMMFNVTGLNFNQEYTFTIRAENRAGIGNSINVAFNVTGLVHQKLSLGPQLCLEYISKDALFLRISWNCDNISGNSNMPPVDNYTLCINANCQLIVTDNCSISVQAEYNTMYTAYVILNNRVGPSNPSPSSNTNTDLLRNVRVTNIGNDSATISYSTFQGCYYLPTNIKVQLFLVNENTSDTILMESRDYDANLNDSFNPSSLHANTVYNYTLQVFVGTDIDSGVKIGRSEIGRFMTSNTEVIIPMYSTSILSVTGGITTIASTPCVNDNEHTGLSDSAVSVITLVVSVPITAVITAIVSIVTSYYCCIKSKGGYTPSATGPALYETPVSTSGVSSLEMKDNMAYGHVTIGTSGNIPTTSTVYDTITT